MTREALILVTLILGLRAGRPVAVLSSIVAGIVSAPVVVAVFGGATGSGSAEIVAFLRASGEGLLKSVFLSGLASEPRDKTLQCLAAVWLVRRWPQSVYFSRPASFR